MRDEPEGHLEEDHELDTLSQVSSRSDGGVENRLSASGRGFPVDPGSVSRAPIDIQAPDLID